MRATSFIGSSRRAHRPGAPAVEELAGPVRRHVAPQRLKVLLEQVGANRAQVATHQLRKPAPLLAGELLRTLEQEPAAALEHRRPPLGGELPGVGNGSSSDKSRDARARSRRPGRQPRAAGAERERRALTAASTRARCGSDEDYQPSVLPTDSAEDPADELQEGALWGCGVRVPQFVKLSLHSIVHGKLLQPVFAYVVGSCVSCMGDPPSAGTLCRDHDRRPAFSCEQLINFTIRILKRLAQETVHVLVLR